MKDVLADIKNYPDYSKYAEASNVRIMFAANVYAARKRLGLSQKQLAKQAETSQKTLSHIENADVNVGIELIKRLSRVLKFNQKTFKRIFGLLQFHFHRS